MKHIHLIGIGGTGLSAIARVLLEKGYTVSGSDRTASPLFRAITSTGAQTFIGHAPEQIKGADIVIRSSAISEENPEVMAAKSEGVPVLKRAEFLQELTKGKDTIAISGSHGKTTTTAMLAWILDQLGTDPSFIAGGVVNQLKCNARAGTGPYFVIEADEYDNMFLGLSPQVAIITNIEHDHQDCFPTKADYRAAFIAFLERIQKDGIGLLCLDNPETNALYKRMRQLPTHVLGYGTNPIADYIADEIKVSPATTQFDLLRKQRTGKITNMGHINLKIPGHHNVLNAIAALSTIHQLGLCLPHAIKALGQFSGVGRRFEILGKVNGVTIIDDYGHHPTEIAATLKAATAHFPGQNIWAIWQPHTFSRTQSLEKGFIQALNLADRVVVLKIYAAREINPGYSSSIIAEKLSQQKAIYREDFSSATHYLLDNLTHNDVAIIFSAGDATCISQSLLNGLLQREKDSE